MTNDNKKENLKNQESFLFSTSLIYEQNINKLWLFLRDLRNEINIIEYFDNLEYILKEIILGPKEISVLLIGLVFQGLIINV